MPANGIPDEVKQFIFEHIDSVEILSVLQLLRSSTERSWSAEEISNELRTNSESVSNRLRALRGIGLVEENPQGRFRYQAASSDLESVVDALLEACRVRRHQVYELIFSPLKRSRNFAAAFRIRKAKTHEDDDA